MRHYSSVALFVVFILSVSADSIELHVKGIIPVNLDTLYLVRQYHRIERTIYPIGPASGEPLTILFYNASQQRKTGIFLPEWGGGGALGKDSIVIPIDRPSAFYRSNMQRIILHEMVHIALNRAWGTLRIPRWFHEGVAMTLSGELQFEEQIILSRAIITRSLIPLDSMEYLNRFSHRRAQIAYSQCHFAVQFLLTTYGSDLIPELLAESRTTRRFENACVKVFGLNNKELDSLLAKELTSRYRFAFIVADYSFFWIGILLLAVVAFIVTRFRNRQKRMRMELEESVEAQLLQNES